MLTCAKAIETVNAAYLPGAIEWFSRQDPDPWEKANLQWSEALKPGMDFNEMAEANEVFVGRMLNLLDEYRRSGVRGKTAPQEAFFNPQMTAQTMSAAHKCCVKCNGRVGLSPARDARTRTVYLICEECKSKNRMERRN